MRAAFQILAIPYRMVGSAPLFCAFLRADMGQWQFIAGGGESSETPLEAAKREAFEESGVRSDVWMELKSLSYLPVTVIDEKQRRHWRKDTYVIPEYAFGFACNQDITLSDEHTEYAWLTYDEAAQRLKWDSNRTALYELHCRLRAAQTCATEKGAHA